MVVYNVSFYIIYYFIFLINLQIFAISLFVTKTKQTIDDHKSTPIENLFGGKIPIIVTYGKPTLCYLNKKIR